MYNLFKDAYSWDSSESNLQFRWIFYVLLGLIIIITLIVVIFMLKRRNFQPLKKKSPNLMIISVIGNFMVIFNITCCLISFESFKVQQSKCYFDKGDYTQQNYKNGD